MTTGNGNGQAELTTDGVEKLWIGASVLKSVASELARRKTLNCPNSCRKTDSMSMTQEHHDLHGAAARGGGGGDCSIDDLKLYEYEVFKNINN